jgi:hypothetical protein
MYARGLFDTALGQHLVEKGEPPARVTIRSREIFMELINIPLGKEDVSSERGEARRKTWKRRLFEWLERG